MQPKNSNIHFAPEEDQQLLDLLAAEASWPLIAVTLKRSIQAVQERAQTLKRDGVVTGLKAKI
jgi:biotin operon repressor